MSDRLKLAREIAARTEPRFIEIKPEPRRKVRLKATFIEILASTWRRESVLCEGLGYSHAWLADGGGISLEDDPEVAERLKKPGDTQYMPGFQMRAKLDAAGSKSPRSASLTRRHVEGSKRKRNGPGDWLSEAALRTAPPRIKRDIYKGTAMPVKGGLKGAAVILSIVGSGTRCRKCHHPSRSMTSLTTSSNRFAGSSRRATS